MKDLNGDGLIDDDDKAIIGDPYPDFIWSLTNSFKIKDFDGYLNEQGYKEEYLRIEMEE